MEKLLLLLAEAEKIPVKMDPALESLFTKLVFFLAIIMAVSLFLPSKKRRRKRR